MSGRPRNHGGNTTRGNNRPSNRSNRGRGSTNSSRGTGRSDRNGQSASPNVAGNLRGGNAASAPNPRISRQDIELVAQHSKYNTSFEFFL